MSPQQLQNVVNGARVAPHSATWLDSYEPATGHVLVHVPASDARDIDDAVTAALAAFKLWSVTPAEERAKVLLHIAEGIERRLEAFAVAESRDQGKTVKLAREIEIPRAVHNFRTFANTVLNDVNPASVLERAGCVNYVTRSPIGVCGLISPWNLPLYLATWKIAPALAYGCTCVIKPSELTSLTMWLLCDVLDEARVPPGVVNVVFGLGATAGNALVAHPRVPLISFTGGTVTAEKIIRASAPYYKKLSLELGGKNAGIVFDDANLAEAVPTIVRSAFQNQGEICLCTSRLFVQAGIYDEFLRRYIPAAKALRVGDPADPSTDMGAVVSKEHRAKVLSYIDLAKQLGGVIECGGSDELTDLPEHLRGGYWIRPTVITGLAYDSRVCQEEIFGPVVTVTKFETEEQVIAWANSTQYGLAASIWSENVGRVHRVAQSLEAGTIWCNCWMVRDLRMPFGGMKASGVGREGTHNSADFFTEQRTICIKFAKY